MIRALLDARGEGLLVVAFWLAGVVVMMRTDAHMLDVRVWATVLFVQSIPYLASVLVSLTSARPDLPASLVGAMGELHCEEVANQRG